MSQPYPGGLILGDHAPGVPVQVVAVGRVLRLAKAIDIFRSETGGHLDEEVGEREAGQDRVPSAREKQSAEM